MLVTLSAWEMVPVVSVMQVTPIAPLRVFTEDPAIKLIGIGQVQAPCGKIQPGTFPRYLILLTIIQLTPLLINQIGFWNHIHCQLPSLIGVLGFEHGFQFETITFITSWGQQLHFSRTLNVR